MVAENNKKAANAEELEKLRNAEQKYRSFIERRNELNNIANNLREERNMVNDGRHKLMDKLNEEKEKRNEIVRKMRQHKETRNKLQQQAKDLIRAKRGKKGEIFSSLPLRVEELKADIQMLEYKQETVPMSHDKENELIEETRKKRYDYERLKIELEKQRLIEIDLSDTDMTINELFKKADEEHKKVEKYYKESQGSHKKYVRLVNEVATLIGETKKKHAKFAKVRDEAQRVHLKAMELREKVVSIRKERRQRWEQARKILEEQNIKAQHVLQDEKGLKDKVDKSIESLKKGEKISII